MMLVLIFYLIEAGPADFIFCIYLKMLNLAAATSSSPFLHAMIQNTKSSSVILFLSTSLSLIIIKEYLVYFEGLHMEDFALFHVALKLVFTNNTIVISIDLDEILPKLGYLLFS